MRTSIVLAFMASSPMLIGVVGALVSPGSASRHAIRWRCFRQCGASRTRAALWTMGGGR
jgi:hypothetical protein